MPLLSQLVIWWNLLCISIRPWFFSWVSERPALAECGLNGVNKALCACTVGKCLSSTGFKWPLGSQRCSLGEESAALRHPSLRHSGFCAPTLMLPLTLFSLLPTLIFLYVTCMHDFPSCAAADCPVFSVLTHHTWRIIFVHLAEAFSQSNLQLRQDSEQLRMPWWRTHSGSLAMRGSLSQLSQL